MFHFKSWKINRIIKKIKAMQLNRAANQPSDEMVKKEIAYYYELANLLKKSPPNKKIPYPQLRIIECYRAAANLNDANAHFLLGQLFLEEAKYRQNMYNEGVFNSMANLKYSKQLYEEAHAHLLAAEQLGYSAAKRLRGLCFINGWGVDIDKNAGFELVVASIEQEGSWERVPQIFADIGLNKPEFFAAIMQRKRNLS